MSWWLISLYQFGPPDLQQSKAVMVSIQNELHSASPDEILALEVNVLEATFDFD